MSWGLWDQFSFAQPCQQWLSKDADMAQLDRLKKFNCFDKVKGGIQASIENKTKHSLEAWLHTLQTTDNWRYNQGKLPFLQKRKLTSCVWKRNQLVSTILPTLSGVRQWHQQSQLHCCSCLYHKACQCYRAESFRRGYLQNAKFYPEFKLYYWRKTQQIGLGI